MMLTLRFGMVLRNMRGTTDSLAFLGKVEAVTGNAAAEWCAGRSSSGRTCFTQMLSVTL